MDKYTVVVEKGESGCYIAYVPSIPGCHTQAKTIPQLIERVKEAIELCLECGIKPEEKASFVGVRTVELDTHAAPSPS
ncbi:MAG: type II toxin-antitoxin system HicB family antitoxin [Candidatus Micrarchaeota archaeon]